MVSQRRALQNTTSALHETQVLVRAMRKHNFFEIVLTDGIEELDIALFVPVGEIFESAFIFVTEFAHGLGPSRDRLVDGLSSSFRQRPRSDFVVYESFGSL